MNLTDIFKNKCVFSMEIFPPRKNYSQELICKTLDGLKEAKPDFISCTYGAGGSGGDHKTAEICEIIKNKYGIVPIAHLTCVNSSKEDIVEILNDLKSRGIENILALRGDINSNLPKKEDFKYASELVEFINNYDNSFFVSAACYPESHPESESQLEDILHLKHKVECGADHLISQLFFDNEDFYDFRDKATLAGINVPIEAGIMPVTNKAQIERMVSTCGASIPKQLARILNRFDDDPKALEDAGIMYAIHQIIDLISNDVDGIHIYTMNRPDISNRIFSAISSMR